MNATSRSKPRRHSGGYLGMSVLIAMIAATSTLAVLQFMAA